MESIKFQEELLKLRSVVTSINFKLEEEKTRCNREVELRKEAEKKIKELLQTPEAEETEPKQPSATENKVPLVESFLNRNQKILIIGGSEVKEEHLRGKLKGLGFNFKKDDLIFELDYDSIDYYSNRIKPYESKYAGIVIGPCPHKIKNTDGYSSFIQKLKNEAGYPHVEKATDKNGILKLSKESFGEAMVRMALHLSTIS